MGLFVDVVVGITLPIVLLIGLGFVLQTRVRLDVTTLNRLVVYATVPALMIVSLSSADLPILELQATVLFTLGQFAVLLALGWGLAALLRVERTLRPVVALAVPFSNTGNFGIPLVDLAFGPVQVSYMAVITSILTILIMGLAPMLLSAGDAGLRRSVLAAFRTPLIPSVVLGLLLNALEVPLPEVVRFPLGLIAGANTPIALMALGAQLGAGSWTISRSAVGLGVGLRLVAAPALTWLALLALGLPEELGDLLLVASGVPVGVLLPIFCMEYGRHARVASAMVVVSTALCPVVVTVLVTLARLG